MGTLFMVSRHRKYVAEYVRGQPRCGTVLGIDDDDLAPLRVGRCEYGTGTASSKATMNCKLCSCHAAGFLPSMLAILTPPNPPAPHSRTNPHCKCIHRTITCDLHPPPDPAMVVSVPLTA